jgi:hypothetical protein
MKWSDLTIIGLLEQIRDGSGGGGGGTVTAVTGTAPVVSSGGATPAISLPVATASVDGYLSHTDWGTFNSKGAGTVTAVSVATANGISGSSSGGVTPALTLSLGAITPTSVTTDGEASAAAQATGGAGTEGSPYTSSDNTGGIQTAVNNLAALRGGLVNLGASRFNVTAADGVRVTTPAITIAGKATAFNVDPNGVAEGINGPKIKSTTHGIRFGLAANKLGGLGARDLYLYGPSKSTTKDGITVDQNVDQIRFSNLQITNFQYGFDFSASQTDAGYITDSSVLGCGEAIHAPGDVSYLKVANCEFSDNDRIGINISGSNWVRLINCTIVRNAANAGLSNSSNVYLGASNSVISDCVIRNAGASETGGAASVGDGIILHGNNNLVSACQILLNDKGAGIRIQGNNNIIAAGNNFAGNSTDIILDSGASGNIIYAASTVSITDNSGNSTNQIIRSGFNASTVPNLQLWLRSDTLALTDGAAVASWTDSSGNGNTAAQATGGSQPIFKTAQVNGSPVVRFNGSSQFLATSGNLLQVGTGDFAVFLAVKASGDSAAIHTVVGDLQSGSPFGGFVLKTNIASAGAPSETATRDTTSGSDTIDAASATGWQILEAVRVNGVLKLYRTGVSIGTSASTHTISSAAPLAIGKDRTGGSEYFDSDLAEVLVFNSTITPQQRNTVEQYLATKYGLTLPSIGSTPVIVSRERLTAQTGAVTVSSYPVGSLDGSFYVSMNVNVTAAVAVSTSLNCGYTDETNTPRTMVLPVTGLAGSYVAGGLVTTTGPFESSVMHIRCKANTNINLTTASGTFTSVTYNAEAIVTQMQ